jgi:hypothetical protein
MTESRQITFHGSGPLVRTLVQALEDEGVTVRARRNGPEVGQSPDPRRMGDAVDATLAAVGAIEAIRAGVLTFRQQFADRALVSIEGDESAPSAHGRATGTAG